MATIGSTRHGSYSTIQPTTFTTYNMKIEVGPAILEFFDFLSQKLIRTTQKIITKLVKKLNVPHVIRSSSPVTNSNDIQTNIINIT